MREIAIYVEGGGDTTTQKAELRQGFDALLTSVKARAREKRMGWKLVCAGGRQAAFEAFTNAVRVNPAAINVLLVDAEGPIPAATGDTDADGRQRVDHLRSRDGWDLSTAAASRVHLMVQCMEAWIAADPEALAGYYGKNLSSARLPAHSNLEDEPKQGLYDKLARATESTSKGAYAKIRHASQLLQLVDPAKVALRCPRFASLTKALEDAITGE